MYNYINSGVTHLINTTYRPDLIMVTWDPASSPYCGEVLYYKVVISSDEHVNIPNDIVNVTCLTATFLGLRSNTTYTITVAAINKAAVGMGVSVIVNTAADMITESYSNRKSQVTNKTRIGMLLFKKKLLYMTHACISLHPWLIIMLFTKYIRFPVLYH